MEEIKTKADMFREFHKTMKATCFYCKHSEHCNGSYVWCQYGHAGIAKAKENYCWNWEERDENA